MTFEEYVERPQKLKERIQRQIEKTERLEDLCNQTTTIISDVKVQTNHGNKRDKFLADYIDSKNKINDLLEQYKEVSDELKTWLYDSLDFDDADILEWRYCNGLKNAEIAERTHYKEMTIRHKISRAVKNARDTYYQQKGVE